MAKYNMGQAVANGFVHLDLEVPGWWTKLDINKIDLNSDCNCALGQLHGSFCNYMKRERHEKVTLDEYGRIEWPWATAHGFALPAFMDRREQGWNALTNLWIRRITQRQKEMEKIEQVELSECALAQ